MEQERKTVIRIYGAMAGMLVLSLVPSTWAAAAVLVFFTAILYIASSIRKKSAPDGFAVGHMTWIIRSIWLTSALGGVLGALAAFYVLANYNPSPVYECADGFADGEFDLESCMNDFIDANFGVFLRGTVMAGIPTGLYFLTRFARGFAAALKNRIPVKLKSWL